MVRLVSKGDWRKTRGLLKSIQKEEYLINLDELAQEGVYALSLASPVDTGRLAASWSYEIEKNQNGVIIRWLNSDIEGGANVALLVQYGHATQRGTYIEGRDFINPAMEPIFDKIADSAWKEVCGNERNR